MLILAISFLVAPGQSATLLVDRGGSNYTSIQAAIDAASPGDTIVVNPGTYNECIDVDKKLVLRGIDMPVVSAVGRGDIYSWAITLSANDTVLEGFAATNATNMAGDPSGGAGILVLSDGNIIKGNYIYGNYGSGIQLLNASRNVIEGNNIANRFGIVTNSHDNLIRHNEIHDSIDGLAIINSDHNIVMGNNISNNRLGMALNYAKDNIIAGNAIINSSNIAIQLDTTSNNTVAGNSFSGNQKLIQICESENDVIFGNRLDDVIFGNEALEEGCGW